jgi:hypothetical protein
MSQALKPIPQPDADEILGRVIATGDLSKLPWIEKIAHYKAVCDAMGLYPGTRPLEYVRLRGRNGQEGKEVLYVRKEATDQLRAIHKVSITKVEEVLEGDLFKVTVYGRTAVGREDVEVGITSVRNLVGQDLADARMKAVTKAKRRLTLSLVGLGIFPEEEEVQMTHHKAPWRGGNVLAEPEKPAIGEGKVEDQAAEAEASDRLTKEQLDRINELIEQLKRRSVTNTDFKGVLQREFGVDMRLSLNQDQADKFTVILKDWLEELKQDQAERIEPSGP